MVSDTSSAASGPTSPEAADEELLGTATAGPRARRAAIRVSGLLMAAFAVTAPFAAQPLPALDGFVSVYDAVVATLDAVAAVLLYGQYRSLGGRAFLALGAGSLFNAALALAHGLSFPHAFVEGALFGGEQTTAWLWMAWHGVFPLFVIAYAVLSRRERAPGARSAAPGRHGPALGVGLGVLALAGALIGLCVFGEGVLPPLMNDDRFKSEATRWVLASTWCAHLAAFAVLAWCTRGRRLIDLWLGVVVLALLIELALSALLTNGRFEVGFYAGRLYGGLAAGFVLALLLREAAMLHAGAARALQALRDSEARERRLLDDLQQRVDSNMAMLRALVRRSMVGAAPGAVELGASLDERIESLARSQSLVLLSGDRGGAELETLIRDELLAQGVEGRRVTLAGPAVRLPAKAAEVMALAVHELTANATRFGALGQADGRLVVAWRLTGHADGRRLELSWNETSVAMLADAPPPDGFGVEMLTRHLPYELGGEARLTIRPDGLSCQIAFPIPAERALEARRPSPSAAARRPAARRQTGGRSAGGRL